MWLIINHGPDLSERDGNRLLCQNKDLFSRRVFISVAIIRVKSMNVNYLKFIHSVLPVALHISPLSLNKR